MPATAAAFMPIPGHVDPVPVARVPAPRPDGRVDLIGLSKDKLRDVLVTAGLEPRQAKLRGKQIWHWLYNRGATDFAQMTDIAKAQHPWLAQRFAISRPTRIGGRCACRARSVARSTAGSATPARCGWSAT